MFGKVKHWLGIEGVKLELILPVEVDKSSGIIEGQVRFYSMHKQKIDSIRVVIYERFTRGKKSDKLIDDYQLGEISLQKEIEIPANEPIAIDFALPFNLMRSEMDELEESNSVLGSLIKTAKWLRGVNSEFRIEADANVLGTALNPFDKKQIILK